MKEVGIGILGLGTVGTAVYKILTENREQLRERTGLDLVVRRIAVKDLKKKRAVTLPSSLLTDRADDVVADLSVGIVVELIGGIDPAGRLVLEAIRRGKAVVTANKALLAERGAEVFREASARGVAVGFEASVAGGIPILKAIREGYVGNRIQEVYGIINGTSNYILTEMTEKGAAFGETVRRAQSEGFAEKDPRLDVGGIDAAQKLAILISLCYGVEPPLTGISVEGIERVTPLDIDFARRFGYVIKLLAIAKDRLGRIEAHVHPTLIPNGHPLADVRGVFNAIYLKGDAVGEAMFFGRGAGGMPTASAVVSDIAMIAGGITLPQPSLRDVAFIPMDELASEFYLRFSVIDRPGVLAKIANHLGGNDVSISSVYQHGRDEGSRVSIVVMTHEAVERNLRKAVAMIDSLDEVVDATAVMRVQRLG